jgi:chromate transporter
MPARIEPQDKQPAGPRPRLGELFGVFLRMGAVSFGGGMTSWTRREVVERRGWIDDRQFLSGVALSQIAPGPNSVNIAVFVGTALHGALGALVAVLGMVAVPVVIILAAGIAYFSLNALPQGAWFGLALAGAGAGAIGLNLASGVRLFRRNIRRPGAMLVVAVTAAALGFGLNLGWLLAVMIPASLVIGWVERRR